MVVKCDNQSAIHLVKHQTFHESSKHIDLRYNFIRDEVGKGVLSVIKISTHGNVADMLTKSLSVNKFQLCRELIMKRDCTV